MRHLLLATALLAAPALAKPDADTKAWLARTAELSSDAMEGRDAGSPGHARAITLVEGWFKAAKLKPAGENGSFRQTVPLHEVAVTAADMRVVAPDGSAAPLKFLHDITPRPATDLPATLSGAMRFAGYCSKAEAGPELKGKIAVCYGSRRAGRAQGAERLAAVTAAGAVALLTIDDAGFTVEAPRWPDAYSRAVAHEGTALPGDVPGGLPQFRLNGAALERLMAGTGRLAATLLTEATYHRDLEAFDFPGRFEAKLTTVQRRFTSQQVLGLLPGTDKAKAGEVMLLGAHIDGYGFGEPVNGDALYNGTLDDAGYVALLAQLAQRRRGKGFARPVLFAAWTAEEKGLLGAEHYAANPLFPLATAVAVINLDPHVQLPRTRSLELIGGGRTTLEGDLGDAAKAMGLVVVPEPNPEAGWYFRSDHFPFAQRGVPALAFRAGRDLMMDGVTAGQALIDDYNQRCYHQPCDEVRSSFTFEAAAQEAEAAWRVGLTVANRWQKPGWTAQPKF